MADFKTVLIKDSTIADITHDLTYAVQSGGAQVTYQSFGVTAPSNTSLNFVVQLPSEQIVMGRDVLITSGLSWTMQVTNVPIGNMAMQWGLNTSLQCFPLASLMTTMNAQINNTNVSVNLQDILPSILRMNNSRELYRYNSMSPSLPDQVYGSYVNALNTTNNPMASIYDGSYDADQFPRGSYPVQMTVLHYPLGQAGLPDNSMVSTDPTDVWYIQCTTVVTEPLFLSPFTWGNPEFNAQGLVGINNINLTCNIDTTLKRFLSTTVPSTQLVGVFAGIRDINGVTNSNLFQSSGVSINGTVLFPPSGATPSLLFKFLSAQPADHFVAKNVVPYISYPRYITNTVTTQVASGATVQLTSANLQLNQLPDLFMITIRKPMATQTIQDTMSQFAIKSISVNLNNQSGLLSSASIEQLWRLSQRNGSTQSFLEFCGIFSGNSPVAGTPVGVPSTGSILLLNPALDLSLVDYLSCGSLGNFNFQFNVTVTNQYPSATTPEICVVCVNSGIFVTEMGVSTTYTGILTKQMVLDAQKDRGMGTSEAQRLVGGKLHHMLGHHMVKPVAHALAHAHEKVKHMKHKIHSLMN
jgi:hypothetical protein